MHIVKSTLLMLIALASSSALAQTVVVGTATPGTLFHSAGTSVAQIINEKAGVRATIQPYASANVYIPGVSQGDIDFGVGTVHEVGVALEGTQHFDGRPQPGLRAVGIMFPLRFAMFVRADSEITSIAELKGRALPAGYTSQRIVGPMVEAMYAAGGISSADIEPVPVANTVAGASDFAAGRVDAFFFAVGAAKVSEVDAAVGGVRALPVDDTPQTLAAVRKYLPQAYIRDEKPRGSNAGVMKPMKVVAFDALTFASADTDDEVVYRVTKALYENQAKLAASFGAFRGFDPKAMAKDISPIEYHPGAIRFYKEVGMWPPQARKTTVSAPKSGS